MQEVNPYMERLMLTPTKGNDIDKRVIAYWKKHRIVLPEVLGIKDRGMFRELVDSIPIEMTDLRHALAGFMP